MKFKCTIKRIVYGAGVVAAISAGYLGWINLGFPTPASDARVDKVETISNTRIELVANKHDTDMQFMENRTTENKISILQVMRDGTNRSLMNARFGRDRFIREGFAVPPSIEREIIDLTNELDRIDGKLEALGE